MLTKGDLQAIKEIVDERLESRLEEKLKPIKRDLRKFNKNVEAVIDHFDKRDLYLQRRVKKIEKHLDLPSVPQN